MDKIEFVKSLQAVDDVLKSLHMDGSTVANDIQCKMQEITDFKAKVLVVGAFSAGKSALLNTFMGGEEILTENIQMETAIATELYYSPEAYAIRVKKDGTEEQCSIEDAKQQNPSDCLKYMFFLPNVSLRNLKDIVLVDMPGANSGIEEHNKAINQYIGEAASYIYVFSADIGTVDSQDERFLKEIQNYSSDISFVLTKCDKRTKEDVDAISTSIQDGLNYIMGKPESLLQTSSRFPEAQADLTQLFSSIDADILLLHKWGKSCYMVLMSAKNMLQEQRSSLSFNAFEIDQKLQHHRQMRTFLEEDLQREKEKQRLNIQKNGLITIISDISSALNVAIPQLVQAIQHGPDAFGNTVNAVIRPVLVRSFGGVLTESSDDLVRDVLAQLHNVDSFDTSEIVARLEDSLKGIKSLEDIVKDSEKLKKYEKFYKVATTGAAILTDIIAPVIEIIIVFLPDILKFLSQILGPSIEEKMRQQVIPRICENLRPMLADRLEEAYDSMVHEIEGHFMTQIDAADEAIKTLKKEKEHHQLDVEAKKKQIDNGIAVIDDVLMKIREALQEV